MCAVLSGISGEVDQFAFCWRKFGPVLDWPLFRFLVDLFKVLRLCCQSIRNALYSYGNTLGLLASEKATESKGE
jgi:hypothetical protein